MKIEGLRKLAWKTHAQGHKIPCTWDDDHAEEFAVEMGDEIIHAIHLETAKLVCSLLEEAFKAGIEARKRETAEFLGLGLYK